MVEFLVKCLEALQELHEVVPDVEQCQLVLSFIYKFLQVALAAVLQHQVHTIFLRHPNKIIQFDDVRITDAFQSNNLRAKRLHNLIEGLEVTTDVNFFDGHQLFLL